MREEAPGEIVSLRHTNVQVHNRYFDRAALRLLTGVIWDEGIAKPPDIRRRIASLETSDRLIALLKQQTARYLRY